MLSTELNEKLTRVGPGTPMGDLLRRFWMPFLQTEDILEPDSAPVRVQLLGESLLAFRNTDGQVGLIERNCPHRLADLFFARNEECGLRCTYHGWKFDTEGKCVDMPTEDEDSNFADKVSITAYPVRERAGVCWAYMGPRHLMPDLPEFEFMRVPDDHVYVSWNTQENNFAQAIEGGIDSAHSNFLHSTLDAYRMTDAWREQGQQSKNLRDMYHARDRHPKFFARDTDYGVMIGARRNTGDTENYYWRFNLFLLPFYSAPPSNPRSKFVHAFVPLDDHTCARWSFSWNVDQPISKQQRDEWDRGSGIHSALVPGTHLPLRNKANDYLIDRWDQKTKTFTGIAGTGEQDFSVQEGMGRVVDRSREHLGVTDIGIIAMRRRLLKEATDLQEGIEPFSASHPDVFHVRAADVLLPRDAQWDEDERVKEAMVASW